ncbi:MAG: hypothetical protein KIS66_14580 [Fimbriimonadaceae bacterium]|nr:hypothetical protein [Fimbriimonadaceae bacterium]
MRAILLVTLCVGAQVALGQVQMRVLSQGVEVGTARISQKLLPDGGKQVNLNMDLKNGPTKVVVRQTSSYDAKGVATHKFQETIVTPGPVRTTVIATLSDREAKVAVDKGGKSESRTVPAPKDAPRDDPSEFWFIRDVPRPGTKVSRYRFDMGSLDWKLLEVEYLGPREVAVGGKKVRTHAIKASDGTFYVDEKGLPYLIETSAFRMERVVEGAPRPPRA